MKTTTLLAFLVIAACGKGDTGSMGPPGMQGSEGAIGAAGPPGSSIPANARVPGDAYPLVSGYAQAHPSDYDIARDPNEVPLAPLADKASVVFSVEEHDTVIAPAYPEADPPMWSGAKDVHLRFAAFGATTNDPSVPKGYWTPRVPGPFLKVVANRSLDITLVNPQANAEPHSIDFHSVVGNKGGAAMLMADPGKSASFTIKPTHPGLFVYHCAEAGTPRGIAEHMNMGMYGLMLVLAGDAEGNLDGSDPFNQLVAGASEHYVFEQDVFRDAKGEFDELKMLYTLSPDHVTYNGRIGALVDHPLVGPAGKDFVIYHAAGGAHVPSFHVIGAIFDRVFDQGDTRSPPRRNLQTAIVPSSGSTIAVVDKANLVVNVNGSTVTGSQLNVLVDHASPYFRKGALGLMEVTP